MKIYVNCFLLILFTIFISCQKESDVKQDEIGIPQKNIPSVCIWDAAWVLTAPTYKSSKFTTLSLGEKVVWQGITAVDSSDKNKEFLKIVLQDSTEGWVRSTNIAADAVPAAITDTVHIYQRPDLTTMQEETYQPMDIVAIIRAQGDWIETIGSKRELNGWIQNKNLTTKDVDIAVALQYLRIKDLKNEQDKKEKIFDIIENIAFENSLFIIQLRRTVIDIVRKQQNLEKEQTVLDTVSNRME
jgi:hypothetical protein